MTQTDNKGENAHMVLLGREKMELQYRAIPEPGPDQVLIKVMATGM